MKQLIHVFCWMLLHYLWVFRQQVALWQNLFKGTLQFQQKNHKFSPHMLTTSLEYAFKYSKARGNLQRITTNLVALILMVFHLPQEEYHKLRWHSKLMKTVLWMWLPQIKAHQKTQELQLQTIREDCQNKKSRNLSKMLRNSKSKTRKLEEKLRPRMV